MCFYYDKKNKRIKNNNKDISCDCRSKFEGKKCGLNHNKELCWCEWKNLKNMCVKHIMFGNLVYALVKLIDSWKVVQMI